MKKIGIALLIAGTIIFSSCKKYLEIQPSNIRAITSVQDVRGVLGGYLRTIKSPGYHINTVGNPYQFSWFRDASFFNTGRTLRLFSYYENSLDPILYLDKLAASGKEETFALGMEWMIKDIPEFIWTEAYQSIGLMNNIIYELKNVKGGTEAERQQIDGEARVLRSWHILKLLQYFAPYDNNDLGIPLNLDPDAVVSTSGSRKKQTEIYNTIISELNEILAYTAAPAPSYNIFYGKKIINAILAQTYLYKAEGAAKEADDWAKARTHALAAMDGKALETTPDQLNSNFKSNGVKAIIDGPHALITLFTDFRDIQNYTTSQFGYPQFGGPTSSFGGLFLDNSLLNLYEPTDIRVQNNTYLYNAATNRVFSKYTQPGFDGVNDILSMFRVAEMYLIVAESYARTGDAGNAKKWLDDFKAARSTTLYSDTNVLNEILNERRKEFVIEFDYRWLDMKRNKMPLERTYKHPSLGSKVAKLEGTDYRYSFFIPVNTELAINPNLKQNPGWQ